MTSRSRASFDPIEHPEPVAQLLTIQIVLVAYPGLAANNLTEVLELARSKPGTVRCAWGASTVLQLACETIKPDGKVASPSGLQGLGAGIERGHDVRPAEQRCSACGLFPVETVLHCRATDVL